MLKDLETEWLTATSKPKQLLKNEPRIVTMEDGRKEKVIFSQKILTSFRGKDVVVDLTLFKGHEFHAGTAEDPREYRADVSVPSTNKAFTWYPMKSRMESDKYVKLLMAIEEGREHEDRVAIRRQNAIVRENTKTLAKYTAELESTTFTDDERKFVMDYVNANSNTKKLYWNTLLFTILVKYHNYITGRGLIEVGINLGPESSKHTYRMFNTAARIIEASNHKNGRKYLSSEVATALFLDERDLPLESYIIRSTYAKIWHECARDKAPDYEDSFAWVASFLGAFYAKLLGTNLDEFCETIRRRRIEAMNRRKARIFGSSGVVTGASDKVRPLGFVNDVFGNVLDDAERRMRKKKHDKRNHHDKDDDEMTPAVVTVQTNESAYGDSEIDNEPEFIGDDTPASEEIIATPASEEIADNLGSVGEAFDKSELL